MGNSIYWLSVKMVLCVLLFCRVNNNNYSGDHMKFSDSVLRAIEFGTSLGMKFEYGGKCSKPATFDTGKSYSTQHFNGQIVNVSDDLEEVCHEIAHYQVASSDRRHLPDYGNYGFSYKGMAELIDKSRKDHTLIVPESIEDGRASILGDLHRQEFDPESKPFVHGENGSITSAIPCWRMSDGRKWLERNEFIVNGKPTNKLNTMTLFESFAEYF